MPYLVTGFPIFSLRSKFGIKFLSLFKDIAVNKEIKSKRKFCKQSFSYFKTFQYFTKFSFHHKWSDARFLLTKSYRGVASRVTERLKTLDLRKLEKIRLVSNPPNEMKMSLTPAKISWKTEIKLFPQCTISHEN